MSFVLHGSYHSKLDPRLLLATILRGKDEQLVVAFGLVCSSFVTISRGTTHRHYFLPDGDTSVLSVQKGNCLAARTLCLFMSVPNKVAYESLKQCLFSKSCAIPKRDHMYIYNKDSYVYIYIKYHMYSDIKHMGVSKNEVPFLI